jgi:branched-chain amino acid transport system substrate-binding protein
MRSDLDPSLKRSGKRRWSVVLVSLLAIVAIAAAACGGDDEDSAEAPAAAAPAAAEPAAAAPAAAAPAAAAVERETVFLDIGVVAPESGGFEVFGHTYAAAAKLVEDEVNNGRAYCLSTGVCEPGGGFLVGDQLVKLRFHIRDDRSDMNVSVAAVTELVRDVGIKVCMCGTPHDFAIAGSKITQPAKVLHFSGSSTLEEILSDENVALGGENHYLFQTETREWQRSGAVAKGAVDLIDPTSEISVVMISNDATGQFLGPFYKRALEANGQSVPDIIFYDLETTDFSPLMVRAKQENPDILHFWYNPDKAMIAIPQAIEMDVANSGYFMFGIDPGVFAKSDVEVGDTPVGVSCVPICWGATDREAAIDYWKRYEAVGNELRAFSTVSLLTYDDYYMLFRAMQDAGTIDDPDAIVDALIGSPFKGVIGDEFTYDSNHIVSHGTEVCVSRSGVIECQFTDYPTVSPPGTPVFE